MTGTDTFNAKGEVEEEVVVSNEAAEEKARSNKISCGNSNKFLINFIRIMVDPEFMKNEKICDPNDVDANAKINAAINILESYKMFNSVFDEFGNIRKDVSSEELQAVKSKCLKVLEHIIATNDMKTLMSVLKFLDFNNAKPSGFAYSPFTGFTPSGCNPWNFNGNSIADPLDFIKQHVSK